MREREPPPHSPGIHHVFLAAAGTCRGLLALHRRQLIHGDLKSSNILLDASLNAKLCGLGSVKELPDQSIVDTNVFTKRVYVELCAKSDVFSLGSVLLELLSAQEVRLVAACVHPGSNAPCTVHAGAITWS